MADRIRRENPPPIRCGARAKGSGEPCRRWAIPGATRCNLHGSLGGRPGRTAAQDRHAARRIEALVTDVASRAMLAAGFPAEVVEMAGGRLPPVDPDEESRPAEINEEATVDRSMTRLAESLTAQLQGTATELARRQAQAAASRPPVVEGELADGEPANGAQEPAELDELDEEIEALERRPTAGRTAESVRLRRLRDRDQTHSYGDACDPPHAEAEPEAEPEPEPERQGEPGRRNAEGRILAPPLGLGSGTPPAGSYRTY